MRLALSTFWLLLFLLAPVAKAEEAVVSGPLKFAGNCSASNTEYLVTPDGKTVSVLFDPLTAETSASSHVALSAKTCEVTVPLIVPAGYKIKVSKLDYRGFRFLGKNTDLSWISYEYRIKSRNITFSSGVQVDFKQGPLNSDFFNEPTPSVTSYGCGGAMELKIRAQVIGTSLVCRAGSQSTVSLDSVDFNTYRGGGDFQYVRCP